MVNVVVVVVVAAVAPVSSSVYSSFLSPGSSRLAVNQAAESE